MTEAGDALNYSVLLFIASALLSVLRRPCDHCDYDVNAKRNFKIAKL